jgi:hypothetical protein
VALLMFVQTGFWWDHENTRWHVCVRTHIVNIVAANKHMLNLNLLRLFTSIFHIIIKIVSICSFSIPSDFKIEDFSVQILCLFMYQLFVWLHHMAQ